MHGSSVSFISVAAALLLAFPLGAAEEPSKQTVEVPSMLIKLIEQVDVPAQETGVLASVEATEGQLVEEGVLLAQIDDTEAKIAVEKTRLEIAIAQRHAANDVSVRFAKKSAEVAKAELRRSMESLQRYAKSVSESELDRERLVVEKSTLEIEQSQHEFEIADLTRQIKENDCQAALEKLAHHKINSPLRGIVVQVSRHRGEWVKPGETVVRILRLDRLRVEGFLKAEHLCPGLEGRQVKLAVDMPGHQSRDFPAKIVFLDPEIDPVNNQVRVWVEVANPELCLRPGMRATMTMQISDLKSQISDPKPQVPDTQPLSPPGPKSPNP
jgi:RND family efflux transporter MFP subunit